jgi:hypothetical protein
MPKFRERKGDPTGQQSPWFVTVRNHSGNTPPVWTFQLRPPGIKLLRELELGDEDSFPKREFQVLQDLGLVYTLGDSDVDNPSEFEFVGEDGLDIPPHKRVKFVMELLSEYRLDELNSDSFSRLLLSIDDGPVEQRKRLIEFLLALTPIEYAHVQGVAGEHSSDPVLLLALACYAFVEFTENLNTSIHGYVTPIAFKDKWVYLLAQDIAWDLGNGLCNFHYTPPELYLEKHLSDKPVGRWTEYALERTHTSQFIDDIHRRVKRANKVVDVRPLGGEFILIVPQHTIHKFSPDNCLDLAVVEN